MKILQAIKNNIPNAITCLNLVCGTLACIAAFSCVDSFWFNLQGYEVAFIFIGLAAVMDFLDGLVARLIHAVSPLGKELDSLCDLVSFGLAPALILYNMLAAAEPCSIWRFAPLLIPVCGALRLARFNIDTNQTTTFTGLPIPANAIFWIGFTNWFATHHTALEQWQVAIIVAIMSWLMICRLRIFSLKVHSFGLKENWSRYLLIVGAIIAVILAGIDGFAWTILLYVALSIVTPADNEAHAKQ